MIKITDMSKCSACHACAMACPKGCISMVADSNGFLYPSVDTDLCIDCGMCNKACYLEHMPTKKNVQKVLAVANLDEDVRLASSSGGVFYALAKEVIEDGGVVFGAAFDEQFNVVHRSVSNVEDINCLQGSKYVQSTIGDCYKRVSELLKSDVEVLFTGTPCQISGLLTYLRGDHPRLITMDFICHGVPSPMVWRKYLDEMIKRYGSPIKSVSFRSKDNGWKTFSMKIEFDNGATYISKVNDDPFLRSFIMDIHLRNSCSSCDAKGCDRPADITVADFWGVGKICESMNDDKGTSVVILRGEKAINYFGRVENCFKKVESDIDTVKRLNPSVEKSVPVNKLKPSFLKTVHKHGFFKAYDKYCGMGLIAKLHRKFGV